MFCVYILLSKKDGGIYIGKTNNLARRLSEHNSGRVNSTKGRRPLILYKTIACKSESEALEIEKEYKKGYKREAIKKELKAIRRGVRVV